MNRSSPSSKKVKSINPGRSIGAIALAVLLLLNVLLTITMSMTMDATRTLTLFDANNNITAARSKQGTTTMIIMSDSRSLDQYDYHALAYTINSHYAKLHNYLIRFVHTPCFTKSAEELTNKEQTADEEPTKRCIACYHHEWGGRMAPWCKLLAINDTMHRYANIVDRFVYIDSDAFVARLDYPFNEHYFRKPLNMFWNHPWNSPPVCTGIQFWRNATESFEMIDAWWNSNGGIYNTRHDYEQSVFRFKTSNIYQYVSKIGIIEENVRENKYMDDKPFFRHITIKKEKERLKRMEAFMVEHDILFPPTT